MKESEKVKVIAKILKKRFPEMSSLSAAHIAYLIIEALDKPPTKVVIKPEVKNEP